jgi:hypothetical protein
VGHGAERLHCRGCTPTVLQGALDPVLPSGSHKIQREQVLEYLFVREIRRPSVGREVRLIQPGVRVLKLHIGRWL